MMIIRRPFARQVELRCWQEEDLIPQGSLISTATGGRWIGDDDDDDDDDNDDDDEDNDDFDRF